MSAYEYTVLDKRGKEKRGILEGDTAKQIRQMLRDQGLTPLHVNQVTHSDRSTKSTTQFRSKRSIASLDLAITTRQLAALLTSGLPVEAALEAIAKQSEKHKITRIFLAVRAKVREGHSLAMALRDFPNVFPEMYRKTVQAGEESGHLDAVLERLADYTENRHRIKQKTTMALVYPIILTVVAVTITTALLVLVVPKLVAIFDSIERKLPLITQGLIVTSNFIQDYWILLVLGITGLIVSVKILLDQPLAKFAWHRTQLKIPIVGKLIRNLNAARFSRTLGILSASNVPILDALNIASQVITHLPMRKAVNQAAIKVREGMSLHRALEVSGYFPPMTLSLIASGESSGTLDLMLQRSADMQEREVESFIDTLVGLLEPLLILVMGIIVLIIVLGMMLPILDMNTMF